MDICVLGIIMPPAGFVIPFLSWRRTLAVRTCSRSLRSPSLCTASHSAMDSVSKSFKLNAIAESLARSRNVQAALTATAELKEAGEPVYPRTVSAIVDAVASSPGPTAVHRLYLLFECASLNGYGTALNSLDYLDESHVQEPLSLTANELLAHGNSQNSVEPRTRTLNQGSLGDIPDENRRVEMGMAGAFVAVVSSAVSAEIFEPMFWHHSADEATTVLMVVLGGLVFDRFASAGHIWDKLSRGFDRWLSNDPVREAKVDAAFFMVAYLLGLPCVPFRPDVAQILKLHSVPVATSRRSAKSRTIIASDGKNSPDKPDKHGLIETENSVASLAKSVQMPTLDGGLIKRYLTWLLAGVAVESMMDGRLIESNATQARAFLRARGQFDEEFIKNAFASARQLLTVHQVAHAKLWENMLNGLSAGECVALLDNEFQH